MNRINYLIKRTDRNRDLFSRRARKPNNNGQGKPDGSDGDGDDDNGIPQYPKVESVQETESRLDDIANFIARMEKSSDSKEEECEATERKIKIRSRIKEDPGLVREAEKACEDMKVQKDINHLEKELAKGNENPGLGRKPFCKGVIEHRGRHGGRLYVRKSGSNEFEILAKSGKKKSKVRYK